LHTGWRPRYAAEHLALPVNAVALERPDLGPAAHDADRWQTCPGQLIFYCFVRTFVSAIQLYQELLVFEGDTRVKLVWVRCPGSKLEHPLCDWLRSKGISLVPHEMATAGRRDLIITTSEWIDPIPFAPTPVVVIPHGLGFHKYVPDPDTGIIRLAGLARPEGLRTGQVTQVVSHPNQARQLAEASEHTIGRTVLGGCSNFDLLRNSRGERADYRSALGVSADQRLIVLSSTWGTGSLFGQSFDLIGRLLAQLPFERYKLATFLHPGAWSFEGESEILRRLSKHIDSGLRVIPTTEGWHGTLLAGDLLIGDNGSVTLHGAMMDIPLLLGTFSDSVVPGTVMADLGNGMANFIDPDGDLRQQIEDEIERHDSTRAARLIERTIARPGESGELLRALSYSKVKQPVPTDELPARMAPAPVPKPFGTHSFRLNFHLDADSAVVGDIFPAIFREKGGYPAERLLVETSERDLLRYQNAAIIVHPVPVPAGTVHAHLAETAGKYIGCRVVVVADNDGSCEILVRDGRRFHVTGGQGIPIRVLASAFYTILVAQKELSGEFVVRTSAGETKMTITLV
jgi:hypothetical protein